ncbi:hypothetical protein EJB05_17587, partial [Eragrostis curvula]
MKPPLPDKYLGNCVGLAFAFASKNELAVAGAGGLLTACTAIAAGIEEEVGGIAMADGSADGGRVSEAVAEL